MPSRPLLIIGNMIAITVTIAAFVQALSWTIAGILILASLVLPLLVNIAPHIGSEIPSANHHENTDFRPQQKSAKKYSVSNQKSSTRTETRPYPKQHALRPSLQSELVSPVPSIGEPHVSPLGITSPPRYFPANQGPDFNPTITKDDYMEYDVELEAGKSFLGEVMADGLFNVYLLDEENMDNLDEGEEFWSETGEEGVEAAKLEFTAPSKGKWFFVVENADDRAIAANVKIQKRLPSTTPA